MAADLGHAAVLQHDDAVGVAHRGEAMRDDERRAVAGQQIECPAHRLLADRVQVRGRLVEDQDGRVLEKGAGDGYPLPLAARELRAALAHDRVETIGQ